MKQGWEVHSARVAKSGGLHIEGVNHDTTDERDRRFSWTIGYWSVADQRFDFSVCAFHEGAQAVYQRLLKEAGVS